MSAPHPYLCEQYGTGVVERPVAAYVADAVLAHERIKEAKDVASEIGRIWCPRIALQSLTLAQALPTMPLQVRDQIAEVLPSSDGDICR